MYIIIRWRIYLQSFSFWLRHIAGKKNIVADWGSRMYSMIEPDPESVVEESVPVSVTDSDSMLKQVHGGRMFHYGPRKTW